MSNSVGINEKCWEELFNKYKILDEIKKNSFYEINSKQINEFRESRLMTKFDHKSNLPNIFEKNMLSILPITRGSYIIGNFDTYQSLNYDTNIQNTEFNFPSNIESIDYNNLYSESACLNCAYVCGIVDDVLEEQSMPTVSGRMSTSTFDFNIRNIITNDKYTVNVKNSQCEIDGGYESNNKLLLIEAKNFFADDFLIRQLYYPYRLWTNKIRKEVIPAFMTYSNDIFSFFIYKFDNDSEYNSLRLVSQKNYIIAPEEITMDDIYNLLESVEVISEPKIPFPQADSFKRVVDLLGLLMENELTSDEITTNYDFEKRQTSYYTNAAMYLGLVEKRKEGNSIIYYLNSSGKDIMKKRHKDKYLSLAKCILAHEVFNKGLRQYLEKLSPITKKDAYKIMEVSDIYNVNSENTLDRRAQTVVKWIEWILDLTC